jgi:fructosamine-3-kinase
MYPYRAFDFYIDKWVMEMLRQADIPNLHVYHIDISREACPFDYEIIEEAKGKPLGEHENQKQLNRHLIVELGTAIAKLHNITINGFGMLDVRCILCAKEGKGLLDTWKEYIFCNLDKHIGICFNIGAISFEESKAIESVFSQAEPMFEHVMPALLHGDLSNRNIFSDGKRITALVDWEDSLSGDPVFDIASWGTFIGNDEKREPFLEGYWQVRPLPEDFELRYWLYYLRVILAKTVHRYRFGYHYQDRIPASFRIQKGLKKVNSLMSNKVF